MISGILKIFISIIICNWIYEELTVLVPSLTSIGDAVVQSARIPTHEDLGLEGTSHGWVGLTSLKNGISSAETEVAGIFGAFNHTRKFDFRRAKSGHSVSLNGFREFTMYKTVVASQPRSFSMEQF